MVANASPTWPRSLTNRLTCPAPPTPAAMLTSSVPIESKFQEMMVDNLNAELVLGTVTNVKVGGGEAGGCAGVRVHALAEWVRPRPHPRRQRALGHHLHAASPALLRLNTPCFPALFLNAQEAVSWLKYTYMYGRMTKNPLPYGATWDTIAVRPARRGGRALTACLAGGLPLSCLRRSCAACRASHLRSAPTAATSPPCSALPCCPCHALYYLPTPPSIPDGPHPGGVLPGAHHRGGAHAARVQDGGV